MDNFKTGDGIKCDKCGKEITTLAFIKLQPAIMIRKIYSGNLPIFSCREHQENYSHTLDLHEDCWMSLLKESGVKLHDMKEVKKKYLKEQLEQLEQLEKLQEGKERGEVNGLE